jgi:hypothetical protein
MTVSSRCDAHGMLIDLEEDIEEDIEDEEPE